MRSLCFQLELKGKKIIPYHKYRKRSNICCFLENRFQFTVVYLIKVYNIGLLQNAMLVTGLLQNAMVVTEQAWHDVAWHGIAQV